MFIDQSIRNRTVPTSKQYAAAQGRADLPERDRDVRPLMSILMRLRSIDERLRGHQLTRTTALTSFGWELTASDDKTRETAKVAQDRLEVVIDEVIERQVQTVMFDAFCLEVAWQFDTITKAWTPRPVRRFKPVELEKMSDYELAILDPDTDRLNRVERIMVPEMHERFICDISDDDERGSLMRSLGLKSILQYDMTNEWANYNKKLKGIIQAMYDEGAGDDEIKEAKAAMESAIKSNFLVTSRAIEFKVNEIVKGSSASFKEMIEMIQSSICIAMLGQANTAELPRGGGSRAALEVMNLIRADIHYADMIRTQKLIQQQVVKVDFLKNFGTGVCPWKFEFNVPEEADFETRIAAIANAYQAGIPLVADEAYKVMGLTRPADVPNTLVKTDQNALA